MSEVEPQLSALVIPTTGVVVNLENEREVAIAFRDLREIRDEINRVDRLLREALSERRGKLGTGTFYVEGLGKVEISKDTEVEWDIPALASGLKEVGMPDEIIKEIIKEKTVLSVDARRAARAAGANEEYAEVIQRCQSLKPKLPTISIT